MPTIKIFALAMLCGIALTASAAPHAVRLDCLSRHNVLVSFFKYQLSTMKWGKHFQIASGRERHETESGLRYETIAFRNGDDLIWFPKKDSYLLFYADKTQPERCRVEERFNWPTVDLPRYSGKAHDKPTA